MPYRTPTLGPRQIMTIHKAVDRVFDNAKARFLGPDFVAKRLYIGYTRHFSLPGLFEAANREEGVAADLKVLHQLLKVAETYLDASREKTKAKVVSTVQAFISNAHHQDQEEVDIRTVLGGQLADVYTETVSHVRQIAEAEANHTKNLGVLDGIVRINTAMGIDDPMVYFVVVNDKDLCPECKRLHLLDDGLTPRVWYLSEVGHQYHKRGDPQPKMAGLHPHCRCSMVTLMPGYGFVAGRVSYIAKDHNELENQRKATP